MTSELQQKEIDKKVSLVVKEFLKTNDTISNIATKLSISSSSVQRYLNSERIVELFGPEVKALIETKLAKNKQEGLSKGGIISTSMNEPIRDSEGHFIGNKKR